MRLFSKIIQPVGLLLFISFSPLVFSAGCNVQVIPTQDNEQPFNGCIEADDAFVSESICSSVGSLSDPDYTYNISSVRSCSPVGSTCKILFSELYTIHFYDNYFSEENCQLANGVYQNGSATSTPAATPVPTPVPVASITNSTGNVIIATSANVSATSNNNQSSDAVAIVTPAQTETTVVVANSSVKVKADTVLLTHPSGTDASPVSKPPVTTLIRGEVQPAVDCASNKDFIIHTILADISAICSAQRAANDPEFTTSYTQNGLNGTLKVSVITGSVTVTDRNNNPLVLTAGTEASETTIQSVVPRATWVLPIDNDKIYGGQNNQFVWTAYPGATGYILEYNLPSPVFSENNSSSVEFQQQAITLRPGNYTEYEDMILFNVFIGSTASKILAEGRVFAIDAAGNIISDSRSSDKISVNWE